MSKDVEVDVVDGEVIITKHRDTAAADETIAAMRRLVELWNVKVANDDTYTEGAYGEGGDDDDEDEDEEDDAAESEPSAARRRARRLQRDPAARAAASVGERVHEKRSPSMTTDEMIESIRKSGCAIAILKRFVEEGKDAWNEFQVTKILSDHWGKEFAKNLQAQTAEGLLARRALEKAKYASWGVGTAA